MDLINTNSAWNKNSPELWAYVFEFLGHPNPDISKSSREGSSLFQERFYLDITEFYREDGGELFVMKHFSLLPEYPIAEKLERIMERIGAASIHFHGIGLMGKRVLVAYEDNLKIEILETWKRMKGGRNYINKYRASLLLLPGLEFGRAFTSKTE
ncbi:MAG: hypothetical protein KFB93_03340 [Simkaniaceae bacterium]|nr:MAG: hypothetical protein KFB93_03340 [Simkaniaceae bacterium]